MAVKPLVNLAIPVLEDMLDDEPHVVYEWLKKSQAQIAEALRVYETRPKP